MKVEDLDQILNKNVEQYDQALQRIRQCAAAYEVKCSEIIELIARSKSLEAAGRHFDVLLAIHGTISGLVFNRNIDVGEKLKMLSHEFDRLYDPYIREYWYRRFRDGERWPHRADAPMLFTCSVCGYPGLDEQPYDSLGCPSYNICPSCGTEFGYDDSSNAHAVLRADWINAGMIWWSTSTTQPHRWDPLSQLKNAELIEGHPRDCFEKSKDSG